jgi:hypothetical protein
MTEEDYYKEQCQKLEAENTRLMEALEKIGYTPSYMRDSWEVDLAKKAL